MEILIAVLLVHVRMQPTVILSYTDRVTAHVKGVSYLIVNALYPKRRVTVVCLYLYVNDAVAISVIITGVPEPVPVCVLLARVRNKHTVVLETNMEAALLWGRERG
jgi:hypothetical protein